MTLMLAACSSAQTVPPTTQNGVSSTTHPGIPVTTTTTNPVTKLVRVPSTLGMMDTEASGLLHREGLAIRVTVGGVPSTSSGVVVGQVPGRGQVPVGTVVLLTVSVARSAPRPSGVPLGFVPESVSVVSTDQWWVLGSVACTGASCGPAQSSRRGTWEKSFDDLHVRGLAASSRLAFIDSLHGFAYGSSQGIPYATDDGGLSWTSVNLPGPSHKPCHR